MIYNAIKGNISKSPLVKGFVITLLGSGVSKAILMLATFIFTRLLSKEDFGSFSFIRNTLNIILCVCALNYVGLVTKYTAELEYKTEAKVCIALVFIFSLIICFILGFVLVCLPENLMNSIVGDTSLISYFRAVGLLLHLFIFQPLIEGVLRGGKHFKLIGTLQILTACLFVLFVVIGILFDGVGGAVVGLLLYYFIYAVLSISVFMKKTTLLATIKLKDVDWKSFKSESTIIWTVILPVFVLSFVEAPVNWWSQVLMTRYDTVASVGSMSAILQIRNLLIIVPNYFFSTFTTFQASLNAQGNQKKYFDNLWKIFWYCLLVGVIGSLLFALIGDFVLGLYGSCYKSDIDAFYVAMTAFPMLITISLMKSNLLIKEHQMFMLMVSIISSVFQLSTMYVLLPYGYNSVIVYFWGQIAYCAISFVSYVCCCIRDKEKSHYEYE